MMNKNFRPYICNLDWLQMFCLAPYDFDPLTADTTDIGAALVKDRYLWRCRESGTKVYKEVWDVFEVAEDGKRSLLCEVSLHPHKSTVRPNACAVRAANRVLYEPEPVARLCEFMNAYGIKFSSLTRVDLCYDFHEFYGGYKVENFMRDYLLLGRLVKYGAGTKVLPVMKQTYSLTADRSGNLTAKEDDEVKEVHGLTDLNGAPIKSKYEQERERLDEYNKPGCLLKVTPDKDPLRKMGKPNDRNPMKIQAITWGSKSSGHQVQLYNKTDELIQVKYKHHIAESWQRAGLDLTRDIWRLEIRVTSESMYMETLQNGFRHTLTASDFAIEEQIETLFNDYANKYFRFYSLSLADRRTKDGREKNMAQVLAHVSNLKQRRLLCCSNKMTAAEHIFAPRVPISPKDYTKSLKVALNVLEDSLVTAAKHENPVCIELIDAVNYIKALHGTATEAKQQAALAAIREKFLKCDSTWADYMADAWATTPSRFEHLYSYLPFIDTFSHYISFEKTQNLYGVPSEIVWHNYADKVISGIWKDADLRFATMTEEHSQNPDAENYDPYDLPWEPYNPEE